MDEYEEAFAPEAPQEPAEASFATIGAVYADGVSLIFDGETDPSEKHYLVNTACTFSAGQRVKILRDSGTYVVEYPVGAPQGHAPGLPAGGSAGQALRKTGAADYAAGWADVHELPTGGSAGQAIVKKSGTNYDTEWTNPNAAAVLNQINTGDNYVLQMRTTSQSGTPVFQIRRGPYDTWHTITTT